MSGVLVAGDGMESLLSRRWMPMPFLADREALSVDDRLAARRPGPVAALYYPRRSAEVHQRLPRPYRRRLVHQGIRPAAACESRMSWHDRPGRRGRVRLRSEPADV